MGWGGVTTGTDWGELRLTPTGPGSVRLAGLLWLLKRWASRGTPWGLVREEWSPQSHRAPCVLSPGRRKGAARREDWVCRRSTSRTP